MLKFVSVAALALSAAAFSAIAYGSAQVATATSPVVVGKYEVRNADRGLTKRIKVFHDGSRIATLTLRRGDATSFCCTTEGCRAVATLSACTTLKVSCDDQGWCSAG
jgi:hypothetical protein